MPDFTISKQLRTNIQLNFESDKIIARSAVHLFRIPANQEQIRFIQDFAKFGLMLQTDLMPQEAISQPLLHLVNQLDSLNFTQLQIQGITHEAMYIQRLNKSFEWQTSLPDATREVIFNQSAQLQRVDIDQYQIEDPLAAVRLLFASQDLPAISQILFHFGKVTKLATFIEQNYASSHGSIAQLMYHCLLLQTTNSPQLKPLEQWDSHDLSIHTHSRIGRTDHTIGATWRFENQPPPPAIKPTTGSLVALPLPTAPPQLKANLFNIIEQRKSVRQFSQHAMPLQPLADLLYYGLRITDQGMVNDWPVTDRPYPSGGKAYELEFYLSIGRCEGLQQGIYRYAPEQHALELVKSIAAQHNPLLANAGQIAGDAPAPPVLITMTARFDRVMYKYQSISYSLILKHVGVVQHHLYLLTTALGLGGCALGSGNSQTFADLTKLDFFVEGAVGEFMLGAI